jgi:hypothetical protein
LTIRSRGRLIVQFLGECGGVARRPQAGAGRRGESVPAGHVDVRVDERGQLGRVGVVHVPLSAELAQGGRLSEVERFEAIVHDNGAAFCEIGLMETKEQSLERSRRCSDNGEPRLTLHAGGRRARRGRALLADMYDRVVALTAALRSRGRRQPMMDLRI